MSLDDRDWYREELAQKRRRLDLAQRLHRAVPELARPDWRRRLWPPLAISVTVLAGMTLIAPPIMTSRCELSAWRIEPVACWRYSWQALSARVGGNMDATRGWPFAVVRVDRHW